MFVFSNLATSIDGKIATASREHFPLGTPEDRKQMIVLRRKAQAILMGASTLRAYQKPLLVKGADPQPLNLILSSNLDGFEMSWSFFTNQDIKRIIYTSSRADPALIEKIRVFAEVVQIPEGDSIASAIVNDLERRGISTLLVEGGGSVMWHFCKQDLIDEYYVTLTPRVLGGSGAPSLVDGEGFRVNEVLNLKLKEVRQMGDELYLCYSKTGRRGP